MGKRIFLFVLTNLAIVATLTIIVSVLGVDQGITADGINVGALAVFCFIYGMGGAFISLLISRWMAKRATGVRAGRWPHRDSRAGLAVRNGRAADATGESADA